MTPGLRRAPRTRRLAAGLALGAALFVSACALATVEKTALDEEITAGETAQFEIVVGAAPVPSGGPPGAEDAEEVTLTDDLPDGQVWTVTGNIEGCTLDDDPDGATGGLTGSGILECFYEEVDAANPLSLTLTAPTDEGDCGTIENVANVEQPPFEGPPGPTGPVGDFAPEVQPLSSHTAAATPTETAIPTATPTAAPSPTPVHDDDDATITVVCPTPSPTASPSGTVSATPSPTGSVAASATATPTRTATPSPRASGLPNTADELFGGAGGIGVWLAALLVLGSVAALVSFRVAPRRAR